MAEPSIGQVQVRIGLLKADHLNENEINYELSIRNAYLNDDQVVQGESRAEILQRWLDRDVRENKAQNDWTVTFTENGMEEDLNLCKASVEEISRLYLSAVVGNESEVLSHLQSRLVHYFWRIRRMKVPDLAEESRQRCETTSETIRQWLILVQRELARLNTADDPATHTTAPRTGGTDNGREDRNGLDDTMNQSIYAAMGTPNRNGQRNGAEVRMKALTDLENRYAPIRDDVRAWTTNGLATIEDMHFTNALLDAVILKWHQLNNRAGDDEANLLGRLTVMMRHIALNRAWLKEEIRRRENSTATMPPGNAGAQSTLYQRSVNSFAAQMGGMSLDDSMASRIVADGVNGITHPTSITFGLPGMNSAQNDQTQQQQHVHSNQAQQQSHIHSQRNNGMNQNRHGHIGSEQLGTETGQCNVSATLNRSRVWPPNESAADRERFVYHPAINSKNVIEFPERPKPEPMQANSTFSTNGLSHHSQMALSKCLSHRKYDGQRGDGHKTMSADEFIGCLRAFQESSGLSETMILNSLATSFSGVAYNWWKTSNQTILTLADLDARLKTRFERRKMDPDSQMVNFVSRKQGRDEYLADYIDEMCSRAFELQPRWEEERIVRVIVDNANRQCKAQLATRSYDSIMMLRHHADFLGSSEIIDEPVNGRKLPSKPLGRYKPTMVHAVEIDGETVEVVVEDEESGESTGLELSEIDIEAIAKSSKTWPNRTIRLIRNGDRKRSEAKSSAQVSTNGIVSDRGSISNRNSTGPNGMPIDIDEIACFGCGTPNVFRRNCPKCKETGSKNAVTAL